MKKVILYLLFTVLTLALNAQNDVTEFLGIPVDGSKTEMMKKLKAKGFQQNAYHEGMLEGQFNGSRVNILIATNKDKVCRILVSDENLCDERTIQNRFNTLCSQFENNPKYTYFRDNKISDKEDIFYEMSVNKKRYEAYFYQKPKNISDTASYFTYRKEVMPLLWKNIPRKNLIILQKKS